MKTTKSTHGGKRPNAGRPRSKFPRKNFTVRTDEPTHALIKKTADKELVSVSKFCLDATLEKINNTK